MSTNPLRNAIAFLAILLLPQAAAWASPDLTPPAIVSFQFAPGTVDVSSSDQTVSATAEATDDSSGVSYLDFEFQSPSGKQSFDFYMESEAMVSGDPADGVYWSTADISSCDEAGTWTLVSMSVTDQCGNTTDYASKASGSTLAFPANTVTTLEVTNTNAAPSSAPAPVITSFTFSPATVTLSDTNSTASVTVTVTGSNLSEGYYAFTSPSGNYETGSFYNGAGAGTSGTLTSTLYFGDCDEAGTWKFGYLDAYDAATSPCGAEASTDYSASKLPPGISGTAITVSNPIRDVTPPVLSSLQLSSTMVDVTDAPQSITVTAAAYDPVVDSATTSGLGYGTGEYVDASGSDSLDVSFYTYDPIAGTSTNGTFSGYVSTRDSNNISSCTPPGIYRLRSFSVNDECSNTAFYGGNGQPAFPGPTAIMVVNGSSSFGSVDVTLYPEDAMYQYPDYASWYLDSGTDTTESSGAALTQITPGQHTVNFTDATGYTTPGSQVLQIAANQPTYTSGTYISLTPSDGVQVTLTGSGGFWDVDNGPLQPSGAVVTGLADGTHTIYFSNISGYVAPATQFVTTGSNQTTMTTGTYTLIPGVGAVTVNLLPDGAKVAGGMWNVDGGASKSSGAIVNGLTATTHTINFLGGGTAYSAPASQNVLIVANGTTSVTGTYTALSTGSGSITVTISPSGVGGWYLDTDGTSVNKGGATLTGISGGAHTVNFAMANGYIAPASQDVTVLPDEGVVTSGTYTKAPPFVGVAQSFVGLFPGGGGLLTLTLEANGKFTGKSATSSAGTYALSGSFNSAGFFSGQAGKPPIPYSFQVTGSSASSYILTGSAAGQQVTAYPYAYAKGATVTELGKYTTLLDISSITGTVPGGTGYATVTVSKTAGATIAGKLPDGTSFSASSVLVAGTAGHELFVFDPNLYTKKGLLSGVVRFGVPAAGQLTGTFGWTKPAGKGAYYAAGFTAGVSLGGDLYVSGSIPITTGTVSLYAGALNGPVEEPFTVTGPKGTVKLTGTSNPNEVKLSFKTSTGAVSGSFRIINPSTQKLSAPIPFNGLFLQDPVNPRAGGFFLTPAVSGTGSSGVMTLPFPPA